MTGDRPLPVITAHNRAFWDAAARHALVMPCCSECGRVYFPIGPVCPSCGSLAIGWKEVSGRGKISSFVIYHQAFYPFYRDRIPYAVAQVELEEGVRFNGNVVDIAVSELRIGMDVEVTFERITSDITLPQFRPAANAAGT